MQFTTRLELAMFGAAPVLPGDDRCVIVRPLDLDSDGPCFAITFDQRWLCDSDGALIFFDSFAAASLYLHLLKVDHFKLGDRYDGYAWALGRDDFHYYRLIGRRLVEGGRKCRRTNTLRLPATREHTRSAISVS